MLPLAFADSIEDQSKVYLIVSELSRIAYSPPFLGAG